MSRVPSSTPSSTEFLYVEAYLLARGWKADRRASTPDASMYHFPTDPATGIVLPRDRGFVDYALRVGEVLQALAAVERRTAWEVLEELLGRRHGSSPNGPAAAPRAAGEPTRGRS